MPKHQGPEEAEFTLKMRAYYASRAGGGDVRGYHPDDQSTVQNLQSKKRLNYNHGLMAAGLVRGYKFNSPIHITYRPRFVVQKWPPGGGYFDIFTHT